MADVDNLLETRSMCDISYVELPGSPFPPHHIDVCHVDEMLDGHQLCLVVL